MSIKGVFVGGPGVGKSSIIKAYTEGHVDAFHRPTISASFVQQDCEFDGKRFEFGIWDTAGAEQYHAIAPIYFRSANVAFVVADASDPQSDEEAVFWINELLAKADESVAIIVVMNKIDLVSDIKELELRAHELAKNHGDHYCMTSALKGTGVNELFEYAFQVIGNVIRGLKQDETATNLVAPGEQKDAGGASCC